MYLNVSLYSLMACVCIIASKKIIQIMNSYRLSYESNFLTDTVVKYFLENFNIIKEYLDVRLGENEDLKTRDDYIQEFLYHMRYTEWNASLGGVPELLFVTNATEEQALIAARAHELYDRIPNFYDGVGETVDLDRQPFRGRL